MRREWTEMILAAAHACTNSLASVTWPEAVLGGCACFAAAFALYALVKHS
jgi:hypothetical protein